jgi:hypothetical protein
MTSTGLLILLLSLPADTGARFEVDPFAAATEVARYSFEDLEDEDADDLPDDWVRRKGPGFPSYVQAEIDDGASYHELRSLLVRVNGGRMTYYSPFNNNVGRIDPSFNYVFRGYVRTDGLQHDAAMYSVSFLNARRQRIQRFVTKPVTGTHHEWVRLEIGPVKPHPDVRFVVIGCHVVHQERQDIRGEVRFDDLWLGKLPRLTLVSDARAHYLTPDQPVQIDARVSGLEEGANFQLFMSLSDVAGNELEHSSWPLKLPTGQPVTLGERVLPIKWSLEPRPHGCYFVLAHLERDGKIMLLTESTVAVVDPAEARPGGEFGWSMPRGLEGLSNLTSQELAFVARQAGINHVKIPLWQSMHDEGPSTPAEIATLIDHFSGQSISVVGLLNDPPTAIRSQFADEWAGVSEVFTLPPAFWSPSIEPVLARFGSSVDAWQLGNDDDYSFAGLPQLDKIVGTVKQQFDRIGKNSTIGVQWPWPSEFPIPQKTRDLFVAVGSGAGLTEEEIEKLLGERSADALVKRHVLLTPLGDSVEVEQRAITLSRQMLTARLKGAESVFATDVLHPEHGLIRPDGAPNPMFLPWRTTALALRGARHLGSFELPGRPVNHVFSQDGGALVVFMAETPMTVKLNLGDNIRTRDVWGRPGVAQREGNRHVIPIGPSPTFCQGCSEPLARWRLQVGFENGRIPSKYGGHLDAIVGQNTFSQGVRGTVELKLPNEWEADPARWTLELAAGEAFRLPTTINLPQNASLGKAEVVITFDVSPDRRRQFEVLRAFEVGLGDVIVDVVTRPLPDGRLEIEQIVSNRTKPAEILDFKCSLSVSGHKTQTDYVTKLSQDKDRKLYYLPNAESLRGEELWLNLEEIGGRRNLNKRQIIGDDWEITK